MTSANENIFYVTGHLCGEFTGLRWIPHTKASDAEFWCFLSKQSRGCWFETPSHPLWRHCNEFACEPLSGMMRTTTRGRIVNRFEMTYDRQTCETVKNHIGWQIWIVTKIVSKFYITQDCVFVMEYLHWGLWISTKTPVMMIKITFLNLTIIIKMCPL